MGHWRYVGKIKILVNLSKVPKPSLFFIDPRDKADPQEDPKEALLEVFLGKDSHEIPLRQDEVEGEDGETKQG